MFQDMTKQLTESMGPMKALVEIQTKMLERLTRQQMECAQTCVEATMQQTKELSGCKNAEELINLQKAYAQELEETLKRASDSNLEALNEARGKMETLSKEAFEALTPKK